MYILEGYFEYFCRKFREFDWMQEDFVSLRDFESKLGNIWYGIVYSSDIRNFEDVELDRCIGSKVKKSWVRVDVKDKKYYEFGIFGCCC